MSDWNIFLIICFVVGWVAGIVWFAEWFKRRLDEDYPEVDEHAVMITANPQVHPRDNILSTNAAFCDIHEALEHLNWDLRIGQLLVNAVLSQKLTRENKSSFDIENFLFTVTNEDLAEIVRAYVNRMSVSDRS